MGCGGGAESCVPLPASPAHLGCPPFLGLAWGWWQLVGLGPDLSTGCEACCSLALGAPASASLFLPVVHQPRELPNHGGETPLAPPPVGSVSVPTPLQATSGFPVTWPPLPAASFPWGLPAWPSLLLLLRPAQMHLSGLGVPSSLLGPGHCEVPHGGSSSLVGTHPSQGFRSREPWELAGRGAWPVHSPWRLLCRGSHPGGLQDQDGHL